jgi:hypothetical protein
MLLPRTRHVELRHCRAWPASDIRLRLFDCTLRSTTATATAAATVGPCGLGANVRDEPVDFTVLAQRNGNRTSGFLRRVRVAPFAHTRTCVSVYVFYVSVYVFYVSVYVFFVSVHVFFVSVYVLSL